MRTVKLPLHLLSQRSKHYFKVAYCSLGLRAHEGHAFCSSLCMTADFINIAHNYDAQESEFSQQFGQLMSLKHFISCNTVHEKGM